MEATSAPPILLPGIDHLPCLQEIRSVKDKPFYCQSSVGTIPFQGRVFLLLAFCKQNASLQQLLSHMATVCLSTNCPRANSIIKSSWPHELGKVELGATWIWHGLVPGKCWLNALQKTTVAMPNAMHCTQSGWLHQIPDSPGVCSGVCPGVCSGGIQKLTTPT